MKTNFPVPWSGRIEKSSDKLGLGGFGVVFRGTFNNEEVALKRTQFSLGCESADREIEVQSQLSHENVLKILAVEVDNDFRYYIKIFIS
jgi:serine/threonine protein kinase